MRSQQTLQTAFQVKGIGLHSGNEVSAKVLPAKAGVGIVFVRTDLDGRPEISGDWRSAVQRQRQTVLKSGPAEVQTVEHLMAALSGLRVDNAIVEMNAPELPGMDGSSREFVDRILAAGLREQKPPRKSFKLDKTIVVEGSEGSIVAFPCSEELRVSYTLDYPEETGLPSQHVAGTINPESFAREFAAARTFCLEAEAESLQAAGLGLGANTQNTLVIGNDGVIDNAFRFPDELARHKVMDLIGDLSLLGADLKAQIVATKSGHAMNLELVRRLRDCLETLENQGVLQRETGLDIREIMKIIPHRYPFLFLDRVVEIDGFKRAVAIKNVTFNEPQFQGHWPGQPIMPGVLQVEGLAQLAGVLLMRRMENTGKIAVLLSIDKIKFRRAVVPGDQLRLECETLNIRRKSGKVIGRGTVNGELTVQAVLKFMLMDE